MLKNAGFDGIEQVKPFQIVTYPHEGGTVTISRTGFTGDLGYELWVPNDLALSLWDRLFEAGELHGIRAVGYAALNQCRIETAFIVPNADFMTADHVLRPDRARMPDEIGLEWLIDPEKPNFNGRRAIMAARKNNTLKHILVGLEVEGNILPMAQSSTIARSPRLALSAPASGRRPASATSPSPRWTGPTGPTSPAISGWKSTPCAKAAIRR